MSQSQALRDLAAPVTAKAWLPLMQAHPLKQSQGRHCGGLLPCKQRPHILRAEQDHRMGRGMEGCWGAVRAQGRHRAAGAQWGMEAHTGPQHLRMVR